MRYDCLALLMMTATLAACGDSDSLSRNFGVARDAPTAATSVPLTPLSMPPTLADRPLRPGAVPAPALRSLPGSDTAASAGASAGQQALLDTAGGGYAPPSDIRQQIDEDTRLAHASPQFVDNLMIWTPPPGSPTVFQQPKKGWLGGLF